MSSEHKRPLYAFALVALVCALFVGNGLRSDAVVGLLRAAEVPRLMLPLPSQSGAERSTPEVDEAPSAPVTNVISAPASASADETVAVTHRTDRGSAAASKRSKSRPGSAEAPSEESIPGRAHDHEHGKGHSKGHDHGKSHEHGKGHDRGNSGKGHSKSQGRDRDHDRGDDRGRGDSGKGHGKGHGKGDSGKGHDRGDSGKGHGKGHGKGDSRRGKSDRGGSHRTHR